MGRRCRSTAPGGLIAALFFGHMACPHGLAAQVPPPEQPVVQASTFELGVTTISVDDYPRQLSGARCDTRALGVGAVVVYRPLSFLALEGTAALAESSDPFCPLPAEASGAPVPLGVPVQRRRFADDLKDPSLVSTDLTLLVEPMAGSTLGLGGRVGVGRLVNKDLWRWSVGAGLRARFGRHTISLDLERWMLDIDGFDETVIYEEGGGVAVLTSEPLVERERPLAVRLGWTFGVG